MQLQLSMLPSYARLLAHDSEESMPRILQRLQSEIDRGDFDVGDVFVSVDPSVPELVTGAIRLVQIGATQSILTEWKGNTQAGLSGTIRRLLQEASKRALDLGAHDLSTRIAETTLTQAYCDALIEAGFVVRKRRIEFRTPLSELPKEHGASLRWQYMTQAGEDIIRHLLEEAGRDSPDRVEIDAGEDTLTDLLGAPYDRLDPRVVQIGYLDETPVAILLTRIDTTTGWSTIPFMGVVPSHRSRGLGAQVHLHGIETLRVLGGVIYHDGTDVSNTAMLRLFEHHDCRESARVQEWSKLLEPR